MQTAARGAQGEWSGPRFELSSNDSGRYQGKLIDADGSVLLTTVAKEAKGTAAVACEVIRHLSDAEVIDETGDGD